MSYAKRCVDAANKIVREKAARKGKGGITANILTNDKQIQDLIKHLPQELHRRVMTAAVKEAAKIVETEAAVRIAVVRRRVIPYTGKLGDSRKTGTRKSWSAKTRRSRIGASGNDMSDAVTRKLLKYRKRAPSTAIVGTDYYQYNYGHIHEPFHNKTSPQHVMWGRRTNKKHTERPWLSTAAKTTVVMQRQAMVRIIKSRMKRYFGK